MQLGSEREREKKQSSEYTEKKGAALMMRERERSGDGTKNSTSSTSTPTPTKKNQKKTYLVPTHRTVVPHAGKAPQLAPSAFVAPSASVIGDVTVGEGSSIWYNAVLRGDVNSISIGSDSNIQDAAVVHVAKSNPAGAALRPDFTTAFEYSDCWVEDSRLVVLNARAAADLDAEILPRTACLSASRVDGLWQVTLQNGRQIRARALVNAAGPWVAEVAGQVLRANTRERVRLVQGSHIVVKRLFDHDRCYFFQNSDNRIFFAIPYEQDFTLIGTTDRDYTGDPAAVAITPAEVEYLCAGASAYFRRPIAPADVVWTYSGVRPLYDDGASAAQEATWDYVLSLDAPADAPAALGVFGGKITTYRRLAEAALAKLAPHLPAPTGRAAGWTGTEALPGGDFAIDGFDALLAATQSRYPFLPAATARRLLRAYGTKINVLLDGVTDWAGMGTVFGADLTAAELRYLVAHEFAGAAADVVWRRSKLGLRLSADQVAAVDRFIAGVLVEKE